MFFVVFSAMVVVLLKGAHSSTTGKQVVKLGVVLDTGTEELQTALISALQMQRQDSTLPFILEPALSVINTANVYKISRLVCDKVFSLGVHLLLAYVNHDAFDTLHSYANTFHVPLVAPWFPQKIRQVSSGVDYALSMRPEYHNAVLTLARIYKWPNFVFMYDSEDGFQRLQQILQQLKPAANQLHVQYVRRISSVSQAIKFLQSLESTDRFANKRIVLDCESHLSKAIIIAHVRDVTLGRRNYHYILSGLVLDQHWGTEIEEFGAVNITGFGLVDSDSTLVGDISRRWQQRSFPTITARTALMYDAVMTIGRALQLMKQLPHPTSSNSPHYLLPPPHFNCSHALTGSQKYDGGARLMKHLTQAKLRGLTGHVEFNSDGRRVNYKLRVLQMTPHRRLSKIGEWSEENGFTPLSSLQHSSRNRTEYNNNNNNDDNKILNIVTINQAPFLSQLPLSRNGASEAAVVNSKDHYYGFCKDLLELLAKEVGFTYKLYLVEDGRLGSRNTSTEIGWDGIIGDLLTNKAQMAVAPLPITLEREKVVFFTKPFMSSTLSILLKKQLETTQTSLLAFLAPFSPELWMCMAFAYLGVTVVFFIVARFNTDSAYTTPLNSSNTVTLTALPGGRSLECDRGMSADSFSVFTSCWYMAAALFGQSIHWHNSSCSVRVVAVCWWFFCAIIVATYTANLAALFTVKRLAGNIETAEELASQSSVQYGVVKTGIASDILQNAKVGVYRTMWEQIQNNPQLLLKDHKTGIERVRNSKGKFALLLDSSISEYVQGQSPCDTVSQTQHVGSAHFGVATPINSPMKQSLNRAVLKLTENGELGRLQHKWWYQNSKCARSEMDTPVSDQLMLSGLTGVFYLLIAGLILAIFIALIEYCFKSHLKSKPNKPANAQALQSKLTIGGSVESVSEAKFYGVGGEREIGCSNNRHSHV